VVHGKNPLNKNTVPGVGMKRILVCCALVVTGWVSLAAAAETTVVIHPRSESASDSQVVYDYEVLRQALEATVATHGPYELRASAIAMNQARAADEIAAGSGLVNVLARSTTQEHEQRLLPVRIPIDKGLISYRVFLIRADMQDKFAAVATLDDLRGYSVGSFPTWADTRILREGGFKVVTGDSYEGLFRMLVARRFDFFSRSADEAYREYEERRELLPEMRVEDTLLLHFPTTRFFFVRRGEDGAKLAARIEAGLNRMIKDGSFDALFVKYKGPLIERAHLRTRRAFSIENPALSPETVAARKARPELWFDPARGR
jgi:ABC-type amino acid transport substrate-binding protein